VKLELLAQILLRTHSVVVEGIWGKELAFTLPAGRQRRSLVHVFEYDKSELGEFLNFHRSGVALFVNSFSALIPFAGFRFHYLGANGTHRKEMARAWICAELA
jgi:hypothetical protein